MRVLSTLILAAGIAGAETTKPESLLQKTSVTLSKTLGHSEAGERQLGDSQEVPDCNSSPGMAFDRFLCFCFCGDVEDFKEAVDEIGASCGACHSLDYDSFADGSDNGKVQCPDGKFEIKSGARC